MAWFEKLRQGLKKSAQVLGKGLERSFSSGQKRLTDEQCDEIFETLIMGDVGTEFATNICQKLQKKEFSGPQEALEFIGREIEAQLQPFAQPFEIAPPATPHVVVMVGVNGSGKTTSIAKLTKKCLQNGLSVEWAACDTFRAAAADQLAVWAERLGVNLYTEYPGHGAKMDQASLAYYAHQQAQAHGTDVLFVDTAGRLHNNTSLMAELARVVSVLKKLDAAAPHQVLLVLDAATGQNLISQVQTFQQTVHITGLIMTKLDGTAKAGALIPIVNKTNLPVVAIGVGEGVDDMGAWEPCAWTRALLGLSEFDVSESSKTR